MKKRIFLKKIKNIRATVTSFYVAEQTLAHLEAIRLYELTCVIDSVPPDGRLLEIGAGTGWQAKELQNKGYDVSAIDLLTSNLRDNRIWPVVDYDGKMIPFEDNTFDIVFSSNVLEHVLHVHEFQVEIHRVLRPGGMAIHVLPSSCWRFWTNVTEILKNWRLPLVHGEHAGNAFVEIYTFGSWSWRRLFEETNWIIEVQKPIKLFYTGCSIMDSRLSINTRKKMSRFMGSSCHLFVLKSKKQ